MLDGIFDLVITIFLLAACVLISFNVIVPMLETTSSVSTALYDKSIIATEGYKNEETYDGSMTKEEIVLMTQIQDSYMPNPKVYLVNTDMVEVDEQYKSYLDTYGNSTFTNLLTIDPTGQSKFVVNYNEGDGITDFYEIIKKN